MPQIDLAFLAGEQVELADHATLEELQLRYSDRVIIVPNMSRFAGSRVTVKFAGPTDGYQFVEIDGRWMEEALVDPCLKPELRKSDPISYAPANDTYRATYDKDDYFGYVSIVDKENTLFMQVRSVTPRCDAEAINRIATVRAKISFEHRFGFCPRDPVAEEEFRRTMR